MKIILNNKEEIICKNIDFESKEVIVTLFDNTMRYFDRVDLVSIIEEEQSMNFHECSECNCRCNCTTPECSCDCRMEIYSKEEQITLEKGVQKATLIQQIIMSLEEINSKLYGINKRLEDLTFKTGLCSAEPDSGDTCEPGDDTHTTRLLNNLNIIDARLNFITDRITDLEKFI